MRIQQRQRDITSPLGHAHLAFFDFSEVVRRGIQHAKHLRAGGLGAAGRLVEPGVFADGEAKAQPVHIEHRRTLPHITTRSEIAAFIEDLVIRQFTLAVRRDHPALAQYRRRVVPARHRVGLGPDVGLIGELVRMANHHMQTRQIRQRARAAGQCVPAGLHEGWPQQQIFRRITTQAQLRRHHQPGALRMRTSGKFDDPGGVACHVTDGRIDLRQRDFDHRKRAHVEG